MSLTFVHTCVRVRDIDAAVRFYEALGFERRGRLNFETAYNVYMGLPGAGDQLELTVNVGREEPYDLGDGYNHIALTVEDINKTLAVLKDALGVEPEKPPFHPGGRDGAAADRLRRRPGRLPDRADRRRQVRHAAGPGARVGLHVRAEAARGGAHVGQRVAPGAGAQRQRRVGLRQAVAQQEARVGLREL